MSEKYIPAFGEGLAGEVQGLEEGGDGHAGLVGLLERIAVAYGQGTDLLGT